MATIISKKVKKYTYYYYVESKRIDGKPRLVNQKYLGTAEKCWRKLCLQTIRFRNVRFIR